MTHIHAISGYGQSGFTTAVGASDNGAFSFSEVVAATLFHETQTDVWPIQTGLTSPQKIDFSGGGFDTKIKNGFDTAVLTHATKPYPAWLWASLSEKQREKVRYFLISNSFKDPKNATFKEEARGVEKQASAPPPETNKKPQRKPNRKRKVSDGFFECGGEWYEINAAKSGIYAEIMTTLIQQLNAALSIHGKVLVYRFDLHLNQYTHDNTPMTAFRKRLIQKLQREYDLTEIGYVWAREVEKAKYQHYHWVIYLDGQKVQHPAKLKTIIKTLWESPGLPYGGHVPVVQNPFYFVDNEPTKHEAIQRISYLAKTRGKGYRSAQAKDYGSSRLKTKHKGE